ncbi:MAG: hypothetical protein ACTHK1_08400 [Actinomycetales bacterium]
MGLKDLLARSAVARTSVLVVEVPGWSRARCAVEAEMRRRGWRAAVSPADADALVMCGQPAERLRAAVDLVWEQLPGPRARATVTAASDAATALDGLHAELADDAQQRRDAAARSTEPAMGTRAGGDEQAEDDDRGEGSHSDMDMGDMDMGDMDMGDMDMGDMDMPMPGGIPLAGGAEDRDGLEMDVLHLPLGPVLPAWPAGLVLRCTVSGDVVIEAEAEVLPAAAPAPAGEGLVHGSPPERLDRAARLLLLAGWGDAAVAAARLRDQLLEAPDSTAGVFALERLMRRVGRSRLLRWSVSGRGRASDADAYAHLLEVLRGARAALAGSGTSLSPTPLDRLPELVTGRQLSSVRLLVAATEVDTATLVRAGAVHP